MKNFALRIAVSAAAISLLFGANTLPQPQGSLLVKIGKQQQTPVGSAWRADIKVIQQLQTCTIAAMPAERMPELKTLGILLEVLDTNPADKPYYLVYCSSPEADELSTGAGNLRLIEEGLYLFWSDSEDVREILPPGVRLKRLSAQTDRSLELEIAPASLAEEHAQEVYAAALPDPRIAQMVQEVSSTSLAGHILNLQNFETRYASTASCVSAGAYIHNFFSSLGLQTEYDPFNFGSGYLSQNILATIPGKTSPESVVIVCAHYDSTSNQATTRAPGADDDASGTAAVMELARILRNYSFDFTVKFIAFSAEEWGLWGSRHYAQQASRAGERILGVIDMDMIAYANSLPEDLDIVVNPASEWLADRFIASASAYAPMDLFKRINASVTGSDHSPFWDQGYSALLAIEDTPLANPYYHKPTDTLDTLDLNFLLASAKASTAAVADLAQPEGTPAAPSTLRARSQLSRSLFSRFKSVNLTWGASRSAVVRYNVYRSTVVHGSYRLIASSPGTALSYLDRLLDANAIYFYFVTAVDAQGRESNHSIEIRDNADNQSR